MIFDNGKVIYAENEKSPGEVSVCLLSLCRTCCLWYQRILIQEQVSGAEATLAKL
ncbi:hypothetical protein IQ07DRAFT_587739 [Pyrenochaeta sp. DS3sAY3a]|nr:hypothetical protein IQ07DRAFT_587739 [Pyrenochaeta sp. DS3sAY3a]